MADFRYEWWTVEIAVEDMDFDTWEFKGKSRISIRIGLKEEGRGSEKLDGKH